MATTTERGWFSIKTAAKYSDFCEKTIRNAVEAGQLESRGVKILGERKTHRIKREWIDAWIEGQPVPEVH